MSGSACSHSQPRTRPACAGRGSGRALAAQLIDLNANNPVVLALPRGGGRFVQRAPTMHRAEFRANVALPPSDDLTRKARRAG